MCVCIFFFAWPTLKPYKRTLSLRGTFLRSFKTPVNVTCPCLNSESKLSHPFILNYQSSDFTLRGGNILFVQHLHSNIQYLLKIYSFSKKESLQSRYKHTLQAKKVQCINNCCIPLRKGPCRSTLVHCRCGMS